MVDFSNSPGRKYIPARKTPTAAIAETDRQRNRLALSVAGVVLGVGLFYAAMRKVEISTLLQTLKTSSVAWGVGVFVVAAIFIVIKAWRWSLLLRFVPDRRFSELLSAVYIGLAANFLVVHMGEFLRAGIVASRRRIATSAVFASVIVERVLDFIALLTLLAVLWIFVPTLPAIVDVAATLTALFVVVSIAGLYLLLHAPSWFESFGDLAARPLSPKIRGWLAGQIDRSRLGLESIRDVRLMTMAIAASVLQWVFVVVAVWWSAEAIGVEVSVAGVGVTFILIVVGLALPNSPMQIGATQLAFVLGLAVDGISATSAVAASIVYTAFLILPIMIIGGVLVICERPQMCQ